IKTETAITELAVGEALVSLLDEKGRPGVVERAWILPPASRIGPLTEAERAALIQQSVLAGHYEKAVDRESAYEKLKARASHGMTRPETPQSTAGGVLGKMGDVLLGKTGPRGGYHEGLLGAAAKSAVRAIGSQVGREIIRGVLGSLLGGRRR